MKKILIVDDSLTIRQQVEFSLSNKGFEVIEAEHGEDGIKVLQETKDISLVITDIVMPKMGGLEMIERIRNDASMSDIPIVILTTEKKKEMIEKAKSIGAQGWLVKPFTPSSLQQIAIKFTENG